MTLKYLHQNLWNGCLAAWCPSVDKSRSTILTDFSGFNNHGTLSGMDPATDWEISGGKVSLAFAGNPQTVNTSFLWKSSGHVSISFWNYVATATESSALGGQNTERMQCHAPWSDNNIYWDYGNLGSGRVSTSYTSYLGKWTHICLVSTGTDATFQAIYLDGKAAVSQAYSAGPPSDAITFNIGSYIGYYHTGNIDDVRVYNRILSQDEILTLSLERGISFKKVAASTANRKTTYLFNRYTPYTGRRKQRPATLWDGCIGAWCPSEDPNRGSVVKDFSNKNKMAEMYLMDPVSSWVVDEGKYCLNFDGSNIVVLQWGGTFPALSVCSLGCWVKAANPGAGYRGIMTQQGDYGLFLKDGELIAYDWSFGDRPTGVFLNDGKWHHVFLNYRSGVSNGSSIYIDGKKAIDCSITGSQGTTTFMLGDGNASQYITGRIDDARFYDRVLTDSEIQALALCRGAAFKKRSIARITEAPLRTSIIVGTGRSKKNANSTLWDGCMGAWCPSQDGSRSSVLTDFSRSNNHGTIISDTLNTIWTPSDGKMSLYFDGWSDYVDVGNKITEVVNGSSWTVHLFYKIEVDQAQFLAGKSTENWTRSIGYGWFTTDQINFGIENITYGQGVSFPFATYANKYTAITWTYNNGDNNAYINGALVSNWSYTIASPAANEYRFGGGPGGRWCGGKMDDMRIYNRSLTNTEVLELSKRRGIAYEKPKTARCPMISSSYRHNMPIGCIY